MESAIKSEVRAWNIDPVSLQTQQRESRADRDKVIEQLIDSGIPPGPSHDFSGQDYGYGLRMKPLDGFARIGHGGDIFGFGAQVDTFPQQHLTIILLSNTGNGLTADIERIALQVSLDALATQ